MITFNIAYAITTYESADGGDFAESGFEIKDGKCGFRELVDMLEEHVHPSSTNVSANSLIHLWWYSDGQTDMRTGDEKTTSLHIGKDPVSQRAYRRALKRLGRL